MANLITKAEFKSYLGITSVNKDSEIDLLIPMVSQLVINYCRRTFIDYYFVPKLEVFDGGVEEFILLETPVNAIIEVATSSDYGQNYTTLLTEYVDYIATSLGVKALKNNEYFPRVIRGYQITYTGGFDPIPSDLKLAVMDLVEYYMKNNSAVHVNRDITPNTTQIQYVATTNFPAHIKRVLDLYMADYT